MLAVRLSCEGLVARYERGCIVDGAEWRAQREGLGEGASRGAAYLSIITVAEFDKGIAQLAEDDPNRVRQAASRDLMIERFGERVLPVRDTVIRRWGSLAGRIKRETGHPPPVIDTMLAATAIDHQLYLVTRNVGDVRHTGAAVFNPWADDEAMFPVTGA